MKKYLLILFIAFSGSLYSQVVSRSGNTYFAEGRMMKKQAFAEYMQSKAEANLANQFTNSLHLSNVGWGLFGGGLGACTAGSITTIICATQVPKNGPMNQGMQIGLAVAILGELCTDASIVCLAVGYARMHNTADIFIATRPSQPKAYLELKTGPQGVGLALKF